MALRLARIEGQVGGIRRMLDEARPRVEILTQVAAAQQALRQVARALLSEHLGEEMERAHDEADGAERGVLADEVAALIFKYSR